MSKVTFGGEGTLKLYKRFNSDETLKISFKDSAGDPYIWPSNLFTFTLRKNQKDSTVLFTLTSAAGLTLVSNELSVLISATNSNYSTGEYYYQLLYDNKVKLNGTLIIYDRSVESVI